ncbi:MAG: aminotransferase class IV [Planctomycetes bacterium]|nr:aminotransferase class IV [Planctomycetota bacterium]
MVADPYRSAADPKILININGEVLPAQEAFVPAMDHGFLYGDSVYETLRTYHGRPFLLDRHLDRLERSMEKIGLAAPCPRRELGEEVQRTVEAHWETYGKIPDLAVRLVVSRGEGHFGLDIALCPNPHLLIYCYPVPVLAERCYQEGIALVISETRRNHPRALDPMVKSGNFLNNILAYRDAKKAGAHEAILLTADGFVAEGTTSNLFMVKGGTVLTPEAVGILDGITRAMVLEEAAAAGIPAEEAAIAVEALLAADEAFITSSLRGLVPAARIHGLPVGDGRPGKITRRLMQLYEALVERECGKG